MVENRPIDPQLPDDNLSTKQEADWGDAPLSSGNLSQRFSPQKQFLYILLLALAAMAAAYFTQNGNENIWFFAFVGIVFYVWVNSIMAFFKRKGIAFYTILSVILFLLLASLLLGAATLLSNLSLKELPEYQTLFVANMVFYVIASLIAAIVREIAELTGIEY